MGLKYISLDCRLTFLKEPHSYGYYYSCTIFKIILSPCFYISFYMALMEYAGSLKTISSLIKEYLKKGQLHHSFYYFVYYSHIG